jgi:hypothetical protein
MPASKKKTQANPTLAKQVDSAIALLDQVAALVVTGEPSLTPTQRKKALKMKAGGEKFVPVIASLATRFGVNIGGHPVKAMNEKLQQVQSLMPLLKRAELLVTQISDATIRGNADTWSSATVLYGTLRRVASHDGDVASTLSEVKQFFAYRHPAVAGAPKRTRKAKGKGAAAAGAPTPTPAGTASGATPSGPVAAPVAPVPHATTA